MRVLVVSENRLAGLGLVTLSEQGGLTAELVSPHAAVEGARAADLTILYVDALGEDARRAMAALRAAHARFIVLCRDLGAEQRRLLLEGGAIHAFGQQDADDLALVLANYRWSAAPENETFALANGFVVDTPRRRLQRGETYLDLTPTECQLLTTLRGQAQIRPSQPVSLPEINMALWGFPDARSATTLRGYVSQLRGKVEVTPEHPEVLLGRRGHGYWLVLSR